MLKIRLSRTGKKAQPSFRIVVQEHTAPIKGKFVDVLGFYRPTMNPKEFNCDADKLKHWLSVGAQPSDTLASLLKANGVDGMEKFMAPRDKQRKKKNAPEEEEAPAAPAAESPSEEAPAAEPAPEAAAEEAPAEEPAAEEKPAEEAPAAEEQPAEEEKAAE